MHVYTVVGYAYEGSLYCTDHVPPDTSSPVFAGENDPANYCDRCLVDWINETPAVERGLAPSWVYLDEVGPQPEDPLYGEDL